MKVVGYYLHGIEERNPQCDLIQTNITSIKSSFSHLFPKYTSNAIPTETKCLLRYQSLHIFSQPIRSSLAVQLVCAFSSR